MDNARNTAAACDYRVNRRSCAFFGSFFINIAHEEDMVADATVCAELQVDDRLAKRIYKRATR